MPHGTKQEYRIEAIIEQGTKVMAQTMEQMDATPLEDRQRDFVRSLADLMLACTAIQKEARAAVEFMERHKPNPEQLLQMLTVYLREMPATEFRELVDRARPVAS